MSKSISKKLSSSMPDAFVILFFIIILAGILNHVLPAGKFESEHVVSLKDGKEVSQTRIVPGSFRIVEDESKSIALFADSGEVGLLNYAFDGLVSGDRYGSAVGVVAFILIVGGAFGIIMRTGAINNGILALIQRTKDSELLLIPVIFILFSLGGAIFGMGEEAIAFCIVLVPLVVALGYDAITGVLITYVATQIGFATSWMNPFSVAIAQGLADIPILSGQDFRMAIWAVFTLIGLLFTLRYAKSIKAEPKKSLAFESTRFFQHQSANTEAQFSVFDGIILSIFFAGIMWVIYGVVAHAYYIPEIATQFFAIGLLIGLVSVIFKRLSLNDVSAAFQQGAKDLLPAALIVGMAKGIIIILGGDDVTQASTLNTILFYASNLIHESNAYINAAAMLAFQTCFNFFVASGSGQAAITMPIMAPLSDLVGVSRQVAVLAFQLGDGFSNIIIPTSASLIGCLGVARIDWSVWFKFIWRFFLLLFTAACITMMIAVMIGYN